MKNYKSLNGLFKLLCICGVICVLFYLLHDIVGALNYPGYSWLSQAVSDLTATDAPSFPVASIFSSIYGILSCICCLSLCFLISKEKIEKSLGELDWQALEGKKSSRIRQTFEVDITNQENFESAIKEQIKMAESFKKTFSKYL